MIQGYAVHAAGAELHPFRYDPGVLGHFDVDVAVRHCAVARSDVSLIDHAWGISQYPFIPGHEIVGEVAAVGDGVRHLKVGQRVGVGWQADSCGQCTCCLQGAQQLCPEATLTCVGRHGGFAEQVRVHARFAVPLPERLDGETAAPLMEAGNMIYAVLRAHGIHPASRVGILGIGGVGHLALQFARAFGAEVTAFSSTAEKEEDARRFGAQDFINTRETKSFKGLTASLDLVLSTVDADQDWSSYLQVLRPGGVLVLGGRVAKPAPVTLSPVFTGPQQVTGSRGVVGPRAVTGATIGGPALMAEMLGVAARHNIRATVESFPLRDANEAVARTRKGKVRYRAVLSQ